MAGLTFMFTGYPKDIGKVGVYGGDWTSNTTGTYVRDTLLPGFDMSVRNEIVQVKKRSIVNESYSDTYIVDSSDKLFLLSKAELLGDASGRNLGVGKNKDESYIYIREQGLSVAYSCPLRDTQNRNFSYLFWNNGNLGSAGEGRVFSMRTAFCF